MDGGVSEEPTGGPPNESGSTLTGLAAGTKARVVAIDGDRHLVRRFLALGLRAGTELDVSHMRGGSVVVICGSTRVALGPEMVRSLRIEPVA
jgi:ferrous iron transport protein A